MATTAESLVSEQLWRAVQPLLPPPPSRYGGRSRVDDRAALAGIDYQLRTGVPWRLLPTRQLGGGSPITCWRRLRDWQRAGVWQRRHHLLLDQLSRDGQLNWSRASLDSMSVRAKRGEARPARARQTAASPGPGTTYWSTATASHWPSGCRRPTPTTRRCWSRWWMPWHRSGARVGGQVGPVSGLPSSTATRGMTTRTAAGCCAAAGSRPGLRGVASSHATGVGCHRYVVERSLAWLVGYRHLQVRYERRADILLGFLYLAGALTCLNSLNQPKG